MENSDLALHSDNAEDVATSSSFRQFQLRHFHLELDVDFDKKNVSGRERLDLKCMRDSPEELVLDIHPTLLVEAVSYSPGKAGNADSIKIEHETRSFTSYGTSLVLKFPVQWKRGDEFRVDIEYTATDGPGVRVTFSNCCSVGSACIAVLCGAVLQCTHSVLHRNVAFIQHSAGEYSKPTISETERRKKK